MWDKRHFDYKEIDVMKPEEKRWRDLYEFDTPVVCIYLVHENGYQLMYSRYTSVSRNLEKSSPRCLRRQRN